MAQPTRATSWSAAATGLLLTVAAGITHASADSRAPEDMAEVRIIASRVALRELRAEILKTEDDFFAHLNKLLEDPEMHVICENGPPAGSHIQQRVCGPRFVATANAAFARGMAQELSLQATARDNYRIGGSFAPPAAPGVAIGANEIVFDRKVLELLNHNVTLRELAQRHQKLEILLRAKEKMLFRKDKISSRD